VRQMLSQKRR